MDIDFLGFYPRCETARDAGRGLLAGWSHWEARRTVAGLAAVLLVLSVGSSAAMAQGRRLALVVGNDGYTALPDLRNAVNDARAVASALEDVGFTVTPVENATRSQMARSLGRFAERLRGDDVALFYFAGHGVQVGQANYLLPTDYAGQTAAEVRLSAFSAVEVEDMLRPARVAMLVFDACRDNPYRGFRTSGGGLAPMEARGTLIAYAAGAGEVAADGETPGSSNGLFTSKLLEALRVPGLTATALFQRVRREVYAASKEAQFPAVYDQLLSDFVFRPGDVVTGRTENLFWQSIMNSMNPADFEAYNRRYPEGTFKALADNRLAVLRGTEGGTDPPGPSPVPDPALPRLRRPGDVFWDCAECPEMVVLAGGGLAMGRYEVTVGEYRAFASATGGGAGGGCRTASGGDSWRDPGLPQTDRHPVMCVNWDDAQEYVSWLSRRSGATYRLPTEAEWERAAAGSVGVGCSGRSSDEGTCPVGSYGANAAGLSDMLGNLWEWTSDCWEGNCGRRVVRGGSWFSFAADLRPGARDGGSSANRFVGIGFRVSRTLD